jgi:hypothetical protein
MSDNKMTLRLWAEERIRKTKLQLEVGTILPVLGHARIKKLESIFSDPYYRETLDEEVDLIIRKK